MKKRRPAYAINSYKQLAGALRHGQLHRASRPLPHHSPQRAALRPHRLPRGAARWLPVDLGLFGPDTAQSWNLNTTEKEHVHD